MDTDLAIDRPVPPLNRRSFLLGSLGSVGAIGLSGCVGGLFGDGPSIAQMYAALPNERFPIPAVDLSKVNPDFLRKVVRYNTIEPPGTIIVDPSAFYVYHVEEGGRATRYGANVGRAGFVWSGDAYIGRKAEWPIWTPTRDQIGRDPTLVQYAGGMQPGLDNPLGSRALYLYQNGVYTLYTLYGTIYEWTIGQGVSSGCIGLLHQDIIDLYNRTLVDTRVVVLPATA